MHGLKVILFGLVLVVCFVGTVGAVGMQDIKAEYSADEYMETEEMTVQSKVYRAPDRERREMNMDGEKQIMIIRRDKGVVWTVIPDERMYMEMKITEGNKGDKDLSEYNIEATVVGEETVNGVSTTKSKLVMTNKKDGSKMGGFWWTTKEDIVVKMDVIAKDEGSKDRVKSELKNLKIAKQDPKLFEIPSGYRRMSVPGMGKGGFDVREMMKDLKDDD